jgi:hypothetical protein
MFCVWHKRVILGQRRVGGDSSTQHQWCRSQCVLMDGTEAVEAGRAGLGQRPREWLCSLRLASRISIPAKGGAWVLPRFTLEALGVS